MRLCTLGIMLLGCGLVACGYSTDSLLPAGVRRIAVLPAENETFWRGAEIEFTRTVKRELAQRAGAVLADGAEADALFRAAVKRVVRQPLAEGGADITLEEGLAVNVEFRLEDARTGALLAGPFRVMRRAESIPTVGAALTLDDALRDAARLCARDAVDRLLAEELLRAHPAAKPR